MKKKKTKKLAAVTILLMVISLIPGTRNVDATAKTKLVKIGQYYY